MEQYRLLTPLELNNIQDFIRENSLFIYEYINTIILKDVGVMNFDYFVKMTEDIFEKRKNIEVNLTEIDSNILPYLILTLLSKNGKLDYTTLRVETINFNKINKEASTYYNYVRFSLSDDMFIIELMQTKIGGMPIDKDIVKFTKNIPIEESKVDKFIF